MLKHVSLLKLTQDLYGTICGCYIGLQYTKGRANMLDSLIYFQAQNIKIPKHTFLLDPEILFGYASCTDLMMCCIFKCLASIANTITTSLTSISGPNPISSLALSTVCRLRAIKPLSFSGRHTDMTMFFSASTCISTFLKYIDRSL